MTASLTPIWPITYAIADEPCTTDPDSSWVCEGDQAFQDGFIVPQEILKDLVEKEKFLETVKTERNEYRDLSDQAMSQRDEYKSQRDALRELLDSSNVLRLEYKRQRDETLEELSEWEKKFYYLRDRVQELEGETQSNWTSWEVGLLSGGVGVVGILAGMGLGYLIAL